MLCQPPVRVEAKKKEAPAVFFTACELDSMLSEESIEQELEKMTTKGLVTADVIDAIRWQDAKEDELKTKSVKEEDTLWANDLLEDFITYGLSPANTKEEAKILLENLSKELEVQEKSGFGAEASNYIMAIRKELSLLLENL